MLRRYCRIEAMTLEKYIIPLLKTKNIERNYDLKCTKNRCTNSNPHYYECRSKFNRTKDKTLKSCFEQSYIYSTRGWSGLVRKYFEIKKITFIHDWLTRFSNSIMFLLISLSLLFSSTGDAEDRLNRCRYRI